jgi:membrane protein
MQTVLRRLQTTVLQTYEQIHKSDVSTLAGSLAFSTAVSLIPLLVVSLSVFTAFGGLESLLHKIQPFILSNLVDASGAELSKSIRGAIEHVHSKTLGVGGVVGLLIASTKLFYELEQAVQRVWGLKSRRKIWRQLLIYLVVMLIGPLLVAVVLGLLGSKDIGLIGPLPRAIILLTFEFITLFLIYKFVPSTFVPWIQACASAVLATVAVGLAQAFYSTSMTTFFNTNKIYGSLASVPLFLIWILILWWIFLTGVAYCAVLNKRSLEREAVRGRIRS